MVTAEQIREITPEGLPHLEVEEVPPIVAAGEYETRIERAREKVKAEQLTHLLIYADREYFSNPEFFTGQDPRFEEALLIIGEPGAVTSVAGNEGLAYAEACPLKINKALYQEFSLQGQPRNKGEQR